VGSFRDAEVGHRTWRRSDAKAIRKIPGPPGKSKRNSSYLQWSLAGRPALYLDLLNAYPAGVMRDYQAIAFLTERGRLLLDEQEIGLVVLTTNRGGAPSLAALADYLDAEPRWARVHVSKDGVIWVRRTQQYQHVWGPLGDLVSQVPFATLERWGAENLEFSPATGAESFGRGKTGGADPPHP
jgi:hypothetical protein